MSRSQFPVAHDESLHTFMYPPLPGAMDRYTDERPRSPLPTPYIQLSARLSQVWMNQWTILILLVLFRLLFATRNLKQNLDKGLTEVNVACQELQVAASTAVSMPHYLVQGTNALIKDGIDEVVAGFLLVITGLLTAVEQLVLFLVNTFKSTYLCLLEFAVGSALEAIVDAIEDVETYVNETLASISSGISAGIADSNKAIESISTLIEKAAALLGETITIPTISVSQLSELSNLTIPNSFNADLETLKASLNLDAVQNATDLVIEYPFEELKTLVNKTLGSYRFNQSLLSVPATEQLTFCSDTGLNKTFEEFESAVLLSYHALVIVLVLAALLAMLPHIWLEWRRWSSLVLGSSVESRALRLVTPVDTIDLTTIITQPIQSLVGLKIGNRMRSQQSKNLARWLVAYVSHVPAALVLLLAITGLVACALQGILLNTLQRAEPSISQDIGDVSALVYQKLQDASSLWANQTNLQISTTQTHLNDNLFGWVNTSTTAVNDTLNVFTDTLVTTLNVTFGGTILYTPILKVLDCIILLKITGIEKGLTWVNDEAHITLPRVSSDALGISQTDSESLFDSVDSTTAEQVREVINKIVTVWRASIKQEAIIAGALAGAWLLVALAGLLRVLIVSRKGTVSKTPFTSSCFVDDIKTCISRPRQAQSDDSWQEEKVGLDLAEPKRKASSTVSMDDVSISATIIEAFGDVGQMPYLSRPEHAIRSMHAVVLK